MKKEDIGKLYKEKNNEMIKRVNNMENGFKEEL